MKKKVETLRNEGGRACAAQVRLHGLALVSWLLLAASAVAAEPSVVGVLRVGASGDYPPFSEVVPAAAGSTRRYRGFDAAIAEAFADHHGLRIEWVAFRWPELSSLLAAGAFDVAMSGITVRPERSVAGRFSVPVARTGAMVLVRQRGEVEGSNVEGRLRALDVVGSRIAVNAGGHLERIARAHFRAAEILAIPDNAAVRDALLSGRVDAVVTDNLEAPRWRQGRSDLAAIGPFTRDRKAYLLPTANAALAARLDEWLLASERNGTLAKLRARYLGPAVGPAPAEPLEALLAAVDERLSLMPFVADAKRRSGAHVIDAAREARVLSAASRAVAAAARSIGVAPPPTTSRFYRAQMDAAVEVQRRELERSSPVARESLDLDTELRPALLRIGERMARLLVRVSGLRVPPDLQARVHDALATHRLSDDRLEAIAEAIRSGMQPSQQGRRVGPAVASLEWRQGW
jgi:cyclohexadienyl dehydratase